MSQSSVNQAFVVDPGTEDAQRRAADPRASAWVSANAGAGKTKVLTDRVVRLLLDGATPVRILCLTFTKAAAANMSIRIFRTLGRWVTLDDAALSAELRALTARAASPTDLDAARRLFARAVETPGGLKIETLHALCERLLHMFPFEANVPARFAVLDENLSREMFAHETDQVLAAAVAGDGALAEALARVTPEATGDALRRAIRQAMAARTVLGAAGGLAPQMSRLGTALGLATGETHDGLVAAILDDGIGDREGMAGRLRTGKATDEALADGLLAADAATERSEALDRYRGVFFTAKDEPKADRSLGTKAVPEDVRAALIAERDRLVPLFDAVRGAKALARTEALFTLAAEIHRRIEARKAKLGALDFDDLIHKTLDLLVRVDAAWVLYKLDRGIDHVLVDEAQDTNPQQWAILDRITAEFAAGAGARDTLRTRFAVGDPKQSIYSFQGAEPREFALMHKQWKGEAKAAKLTFEDVELKLSFRSTLGVLRAVDATFAVSEHYDGLSFDDAAVGTVHTTARAGAPGTVELWPIAEPADEVEPDAWAAPVDAPEANAPAIVTARRIARAVKAWITTGDTSGRVWRPGEVLVLVRKRGPAFEEVIRALKGAGVPVAGQDRLDVAAHIAVSDLVAIGRAGLLPADDLTLACALKTPLVGLTDEDLVRIAAGRDRAETLEDALARHAAAGDDAAIRGRAALAGWILSAAAQGPFGFYAGLLGPGQGRARLVARLGGEAGDAIDVFLLAAAQAEDGADAPSLSGFLARYVGSEGGHTVKRDMESGRDEVRVMTVHGAKGLEAPVVVVIDGCEPPGGTDPPLLAMPGGGPPVWSSAKPHDSTAIAAARETLHARGREEHNRLLYVAMTRAADRLVVAPFRGQTPAGPTAWCEMIRTGMEQKFGAGDGVETAYGPVTLWQDGSGPETGTAGPATVPDLGAIPSWLRTPVPAEAVPAPPLSPSGAMRAADGDRRISPRRTDREARDRGKLIHALLEHLPRVDPASRRKAAFAVVRARAPSFPEGKRAGIVEGALHLIEAPKLAALFAPDARAEVSLSGRVVVEGVERPIFGRIDRVAVTADTVLIADFKTGRPPEDDATLPRADAAQIALYARLLAKIYPNHRIRPMLVWTSGPVIRQLTDAEQAEALEGLGLT